MGLSPPFCRMHEWRLCGLSIRSLFTPPLTSWCETFQTGLAVSLAAFSFYCTEVCAYRTLLGSAFCWVLRTPILSHQHSEIDSAVYELPLRIPEKIPEKPATSRAAKLSPRHQLRSAAGATPFLFIGAQPEGNSTKSKVFLEYCRRRSALAHSWNVTADSHGAAFSLPFLP